MNRRSLRLLMGVVLFGIGLRVWNLDAKPIWSDEVLTALFGLGKSFTDVPVGHLFALTELNQLFTLRAETACAQIVQTVTTQSVHPPLYFCWLHDWLRWIHSLPLSWVWQLRSFSVVLGGVAIVALYRFNYLAFSCRAAEIGAALMAVSPFAVYLSQEARHYTLPMLLVIFALTGLYQILQDLQVAQVRWSIWLGWIVVNSVGFYVHYFFLIAFTAQIATLIVSECWQLRKARSRGLLIAAISIVVLTYLPWLPTLVSHLSRPETDWLQPTHANWSEWIAPLYQLPIGWILMLISLPAESQPKWIAIPMGVGMVIFWGWLIRQLRRPVQQLWQRATTQLATRMLVVYVLVVLLEFGAIVYLLDKDITRVPRYGFLYFPAVCALVGAALSQTSRKASRIFPFRPASLVPFRRRSTQRRRRSRLPYSSTVWIVLLVGLLSSSFVVSNLAFQKPYRPDRIAAGMRTDRSRLVVFAYDNFQEVALGLSLGLALQQADPLQPGQFVFLHRSPDYRSVWAAIAQLHPQLPLELWLVGPGLRRNNFPPSLAIESGHAHCDRDSDHFDRRGVPYQLYHCGLS